MGRIRRIDYNTGTRRERTTGVVMLMLVWIHVAVFFGGGTRLRRKWGNRRPSYRRQRERDAQCTLQIQLR